MKCPWCAADLKGDEIPEEFRAIYGWAMFYSRVLPIRNLSHVVISWQCPDCGRTWKSGRGMQPQK